MDSVKALLPLIKAGDQRAIARGISLCENNHPIARDLLAELYRCSKGAHVIGFTGAPGAGKSTLVDSLARVYRAQRKKVAILAVDPSSPFSGGALLGDRIRMSRAEEHRDIFIRSMASRGAGGGLAAATSDALVVLDAAGFELVLLETVGVGQVEVDVARTANTCVLLLVPGMGDVVQTLKAGVIEVADIFVINKSDRDGAESLHKDLLDLMHITEYESGTWRPPVLRTIAQRGEGTRELVNALQAHKQWLRGSKHGTARQEALMIERLLDLVGNEMRKRVAKNGVALLSMARGCLRHSIDPHKAALDLLRDAALPGEKR